MVKNGGERICGWDAGEGDVVFDPVPLRPLDSTAAGDSFNAGFLAARLDGAGLVEAIGAGAALAGALPGQFLTAAPVALVEIDRDVDRDGWVINAGSARRNQRL